MAFSELVVQHPPCPERRFRHRHGDGFGSGCCWPKDLAARPTWMSFPVGRLGLSCKISYLSGIGSDWKKWPDATAECNWRGWKRWELSVEWTWAQLFPSHAWHQFSPQICWCFWGLHCMSKENKNLQTDREREDATPWFASKLLPTARPFPYLSPTAQHEAGQRCAAR